MPRRLSWTLLTTSLTGEPRYRHLAAAYLIPRCRLRLWACLRSPLHASTAHLGPRCRKDRRLHPPAAAPPDLKTHLWLRLCCYWTTPLRLDPTPFTASWPPSRCIILGPTRPRASQPQPTSGPALPSPTSSTPLAIPCSSHRSPPTWPLMKPRNPLASMGASFSAPCLPAARPPASASSQHYIGPPALLLAPSGTSASALRLCPPTSPPTQRLRNYVNFSSL